MQWSIQLTLDFFHNSWLISSIMQKTRSIQLIQKRCNIFIFQLIFADGSLFPILEEIHSKIKGVKQFVGLGTEGSISNLKTNIKHLNYEEILRQAPGICHWRFNFGSIKFSFALFVLLKKNILNFQPIFTRMRHLDYVILLEQQEIRKESCILTDQQCLHVCLKSTDYHNLG